jgi:hypothetical protein
MGVNGEDTCTGTGRIAAWFLNYRYSTSLPFAYVKYFLHFDRDHAVFSRITSSMFPFHQRELENPIPKYGVVALFMLVKADELEPNSLPSKKEKLSPFLMLIPYKCHPLPSWETVAIGRVNVPPPST